MSKVYIVTEGEYSDYKICGVFSSREKAEAFAPKECGAEVTEWDLDRTDTVYQKVYRVEVSIKTGYATSWPESWEMVPRDYSNVCIYPRLGTTGVAYARSVVSNDHALKIAGELRQEELRKRATV